MGKEKRDFSETSIREIREKFLARALNEMRWRDGERICIIRRDESLRKSKNHNSYSKQSRFLCGWLPQDKTIHTITDGSVLRCVLFTLYRFGFACYPSAWVFTHPYKRQAAAMLLNGRV